MSFFEHTNLGLSRSGESAENGHSGKTYALAMRLATDKPECDAVQVGLSALAALFADSATTPAQTTWTYATKPLSQ